MKKKELEAKYYELLYAVGNKYPGESRHETALRYIKDAEAPESIDYSGRGWPVEDFSAYDG